MPRDGKVCPDRTGTVSLEAGRLRLRPWELTDLAAMEAIFDDPEIARWTPVESPFDRAAAERYFERGVRASRTGRWLQLAVLDDGVPAGEVTCFTTKDHRVAELAYATGRDYRGRGYAPAAILAVIGYVRHAWKTDAVRAMIAPENGASIRVAEKCGFLRRPGTVRRTRGGRSVELAEWRRE